MNLAEAEQWADEALEEYENAEETDRPDWMAWYDEWLRRYEIVERLRNESEDSHE